METANRLGPDMQPVCHKYICIYMSQVGTHSIGMGLRWYNCGNSEEPLELAIQQLAQTIKDYDNSQQEKNQCFVPPALANTNPPTPGGIH